MHGTTRPSLAVLAAGALILPLAACSSDPDPAETPVGSPDVTVVEEPATEATADEVEEPTAEPTAEPTDEAGEPTPQPTIDEGGEPAPGDPLQATLQPGETALTQYFEVTMLGRESNDDATAMGIEVSVCYVAEHPGANDDGTTRVSTDPWSFGVYDGETQLPEDVQYLPVGEFEPSTEFTPAYEETQLQVGDCNTGWIAVEHGNPDLAWLSVRYQPADFDDDITWDLSAG